MKIPNVIVLVVIVCLIGAVAHLYYDDYVKSKKWREKIARHEFVLDSLSQIVKHIDKQVYEKDSILVAYMQTLNKSLLELDKEAAKDRTTLNQNELKQAEMLKAFCDNIQVTPKPDFCK